MASFNKWIALKTILVGNLNMGIVDNLSVEPKMHRSEDEKLTTDYYLLLEREDTFYSNETSESRDEKYIIDTLLMNRMTSVKPPYDVMVDTMADLIAEYQRLLKANFDTGTFNEEWTVRPMGMKGNNAINVQFTAFKVGVQIV